MKKINILLYAVLGLSVLISDSCGENYLNVLPEDKITSAIFWKNESDVELAINGIYAMLRDLAIYGYGPGMDARTANAYQWAYWEGDYQSVGNGSLTPSSAYVGDHWTACYGMIYRANYFLANIDKASLAEDKKNIYIGEAHFLRGVAYSLLADDYGGAPLMTSVMSVDSANMLKRASQEETWNQAISDYNIAIENLPVVASQPGQATMGAALGMEMRAYLYQNKYPEVLTVISRIDSLSKYHLFHSYKGLFQEENEDNEEVMFDVQYMAGPNGQGSSFDARYKPLTIGDVDLYGGSNSVSPIQNLVDAYETINGSPIDPAHPYENRDPRLDFTILRPGAYYEGLLYPVDVKNHTGQKVGFGWRKYTIEKPVIYNQGSLNFIVLRYADVILAKAEALIETGGNVDDAVALINNIREGRDDVKISPLPMGMSRDAARKALRHERRVEFAGEGLYWADIRRWNIGPEIYPLEIRGADGSLVEVKFPDGYNSKYNLLPIPDQELSMDPNLTQNPGW